MGWPHPAPPPEPYDNLRRKRPWRAPWVEPEPLGWVDRHPHLTTLVIAVPALTAMVIFFLWQG